MYMPRQAEISTSASCAISGNEIRHSAAAERAQRVLCFTVLLLTGGGLIIDSVLIAVWVIGRRLQRFWSLGLSLHRGYTK
jgi:hypothetical protein